MGYKIANLTLPLVMEEVEEVLQDYPPYPYQAAFSIHKLRQLLIAEVLSQIPNEYTVIEDTEELSIQHQNSHTPLQKRLQREMIIRQSILDILQKNTEWHS
ncbi:hypothetical protein Cri9333_4203 [Crinalium epipsammum PCC 9333]|uniref:Late competence development protein ComFB n=1 Tax=Crinalium epipsammum PCC 9333 TaxID=1173022 RepID=K9W6A6_9CYAN|nr:hypothetical protein [Crinalium epipsammum]AFZ14995.1 hypothetical protein Cri9333_4203 [Crinalium epipsammum PCC 9333]